MPFQIVNNLAVGDKKHRVRAHFLRTEQDLKISLALFEIMFLM